MKKRGRALRRRYGHATENWEHNASTGNDILRVGKNKRIIRVPSGPGQYMYKAEYWGDYSLKYPVKGVLRGALAQAKKDLPKLAKA